MALVEVLHLAAVLLLMRSMHPALRRGVSRVTAAARGVARGASRPSTAWKICECLEGLGRPWHLPPGGGAPPHLDLALRP